MRAIVSKWIVALLSLGLLAVAGQAAAGCNNGCKPPAPPQVPHNPKPPCNSCGGGGHGGGKGSVDVNVNVNVKAGASASASGSASGSGTYYGGGYGNWSQTPGYPQQVGGFNVMTADEKFESYSESKTMTRRMVLQATCIDDRGLPHPASQVRGDRDILDSYEGEVYRCIAGTRMQWIYADYDGKVNFDGGKTVTCQKGDALWFSKGELICRKQIAARQCNERSLLRRFGAGIKILTVTRSETITKERRVAAQSSQMSTMSFDGGVGGFVQ